MAVPIKLPDLGTNVEECKVLSWLVKEGDKVRRGDILANIETDKAVAELESTAEGVLLRQVVSAGGTARPGDILAFVGQPGEYIPVETTATPPSAKGPAVGEVRTSPAVLAPAGGVIRVSPVVRNLAAKLGVELASVKATGAGGMITREDVLRASRGAAGSDSSPRGEPLARSQAAVARAVLRSWKEIPHLYVTVEIDMTAAERLRAAGEPRSSRPSYDVIFLKSMAGAVEAVPLLAARLEGERIVQPQGIHIALAIGFDNELFLPVIRDVDRKDLKSLQGEIAALASQVRARTLKPEQMTGGCMALSNLGMYPLESFAAIIFPEHSAMLAVGAVHRKVVAVNDCVEVRPVVTAQLAVDHRLINGRTAAEFLCKIKQIIELGEFI